MGRAITLRLTQSEWAEYQRLGGIKWIRMFFRMSAGIQKEIKEENALQWKKENS
jgi:post-segregation antitoxin (ccd killing protein)